jgi:hypothetical protein
MKGFRSRPGSADEVAAPGDDLKAGRNGLAEVTLVRGAYSFADANGRFQSRYFVDQGLSEL